MIRALGAGAVTVGCLLAGLPASGQHYANATMTMMINYAAGSNTDIEARVFARHLPRVLGGNPNMLVVARPGAGGLVGINYLGSGAVKADGLTFCFCTPNPVAGIVGDPALKVKYSDFGFIGGVAQWGIAYGRRDLLPGGSGKPADIVKAEQVYAAGDNPTSVRDMRMKLTLELIGAKHRLVTGYPSTAQANQAILRKETNFTTASTPGYSGQAVPNLIAPGIAMPFWYYQISAPGGGFKRSRDLEAMGVPAYVDVYREVHGREPSGPEWDAFVLLNDLSTMLRIVILPKGAPQASLDALRRAFAALEKDAAFQSDYEKLIKVKAELISAQDGQAMLESLGRVKPEVAETLRRYAAKR